MCCGFHCCLAFCQFWYALFKLLIGNTVDAIQEVLNFVRGTRVVPGTFGFFYKIGYWFEKNVASNDIRTLNNDLNIALTVAWCILTTQYPWVLGQKTYLCSIVNKYLFWIHLF